MSTIWHTNQGSVRSHRTKTYHNGYIPRSIYLGKPILTNNISSYIIYQYSLKWWLYLLKSCRNWCNCDHICNFSCITTWMPHVHRRCRPAPVELAALHLHCCLPPDNHTSWHQICICWEEQIKYAYAEKNNKVPAFVMWSVIIMCFNLCALYNYNITY